VRLQAAVDSTLWTTFLEDLCVATGSFGALMMPVQRRSRHAAISTSNLAAGLDEYFADNRIANDGNVHARPFLLRDGIARNQQYIPWR